MFRRSGFAAIFFSIIVNLFVCQGNAAERPLQLLIIDSQKGEPYRTVRRSVLNHLKQSGFHQGDRLLVTYYSIGNYPGTVKNILSGEKDKNFDAVLLNGTMALIGAKRFGMGDSRFKFIFGSVTDPVGIGVIDGFNSPPKNNFSGVAYPVNVKDRLRFIKKWLPDAKRLGLIYADMPQSKSYNQWLKTALEQEEFQDFELNSHRVPFVPSEGGHIRMAMLAEKYIQEMNPIVDVFISPNDQMGVQRPFVEVMARWAEKPLVGISKRDVTEGWGATLSIYSSMENAGEIAGQMIIDLYKGREMTSIYPVYPRYGMAFDRALCRRFGIVLPEPSSHSSSDAVLVVE